MSGGSKFTVTQKTIWSEDHTETDTEEFSQSMNIGCEFMSTEMDQRISTQMSRTFSTGGSSEKSVEVTCQYYMDGTSYKTGSLFQFMVSSKKNSTKVVWNPLYVACTRGHVPRCPPYTVCEPFEECTKCVLVDGIMGQGRFMPRINHLKEKFTTEDDIKKPTVQRQVTDPYANLRATTPCRDLKNKKDCDDRGDCKPKMKGGILKKCKHIKCGKIKTHEACIGSHKACYGRFVGLKFSKCSKKKTE